MIRLIFESVGESLSNEDNLEILKTVKEGVAIVTGECSENQNVSTLVKVRNRYSEPGAKRPRSNTKHYGMRGLESSQRYEFEVIQNLLWTGIIIMVTPIRPNSQECCWRAFTNLRVFR